MTWYGACGVEFCADCLPIYDADNNPIGDEPPVVIPPGQVDPFMTATDPYGSLDRLWPHTRAWYEGMRRHEPTPIYSDLCRKYGVAAVVGEAT